MSISSLELNGKIKAAAEAEAGRSEPYIIHETAATTNGEQAGRVCNAKQRAVERVTRDRAMKRLLPAYLPGVAMQANAGFAKRRVQHSTPPGRDSCLPLQSLPLGVARTAGRQSAERLPRLRHCQ